MEKSDGVRALVYLSWSGKALLIREHWSRALKEGGGGCPGVGGGTASTNVLRRLMLGVTEARCTGQRAQSTVSWRRSWELSDQRRWGWGRGEREIARTRRALWVSFRVLTWTLQEKGSHWRALSRRGT